MCCYISQDHPLTHLTFPDGRGFGLVVWAWGLLLWWTCLSPDSRYFYPWLPVDWSACSYSWLSIRSYRDPWEHFQFWYVISCKDGVFLIVGSHYVGPEGSSSHACSARWWGFGYPAFLCISWSLFVCVLDLFRPTIVRRALFDSYNNNY